MKPAPSTLERESTLPVKESIEFTIGNPRALMRINAKQYSDVTTAIIREYSTNAYDAHVMAGHTDPIEISLPSALNPYFEVRDHGVGMNVDTFRQIYTKFGESDKDERVDVNGQMGIGSKSGVAYTTQFTVVSVKDKIKTHAKIRREKDWAIYMDIIAEEIVDEPNGTTIRIPVHNVDEFRHKAYEFYKFWLPGRVLIDGEPSQHAVGQKIADNLYYSQQWNTSYVVLANVPYRINNPAALFVNSKLSSLNFVAYVDDLADEFGNSPIDFTPSREDLEYSDLTKATLQKVISDFEADLIATAKAEISKAKSHSDAYAAWAKWRGTAGGRLFGELEFKGTKFRSDFPVMGHRYSLRSSHNAVHSIKEWGVEEVGKTLFVTDFDINIGTEVKRRVKAYIAQEYPDDNITIVIFTRATSFDCVWVDWSVQKVVTWKALKDALPRAKSGGRSYVPGSGRVPGSWDYFTRDGKQHEQSCPTNKTLMWISKQDSHHYDVQAILQMLESDAVVLIVPMNRYEKLHRENPQIERFISWARKHIELDGEKLLDADGKKYFASCVGDNRGTWISKLDMSRVDDPDLKAAKSLQERRDTLLAEYDKHKRLAIMVRLGYNGFKEYVAPESDDFYKKYPLLAHLSVYRPIDDDIYIYINAKYKAESEKKK